jgi:hypothetical protein
VSDRLIFLTANVSGKVRRVTLNGVSYLVCPATMIVPGVLPGSQGPLFYPKPEIAGSVGEWDGIPLTAGHPISANGLHVSASEPGVVDRIGLGFVWHSAISGRDRPHSKGDGVLTGEAWFDEAKTRRVNPDILTALENGRPVELSTGLFTRNVDAPPGSHHNGRPYTHIATGYRPDHLAILVGSEIGACSIRDGCGVLANRTFNANPEGHNQYTKGLTGAPLKAEIVKYLKDHGEVRAVPAGVSAAKSLTDMRADLGHKRFDPSNPLKNPVHKALAEMRDSGHVEVTPHGYSNATFRHSGKELTDNDQAAYARVATAKVCACGGTCKRCVAVNDANFVSEQQRRYLWSQHPEIAEAWAHGEHTSDTDHKMPSGPGPTVRGPEAKAARKRKRKVTGNSWSDAARQASIEARRLTYATQIQKARTTGGVAGWPQRADEAVEHANRAMTPHPTVAAAYGFRQGGLPEALQDKVDEEGTTEHLRMLHQEKAVGHQDAAEVHDWIAAKHRQIADRIRSRTSRMPPTGSINRRRLDAHLAAAEGHDKASALHRAQALEHQRSFEQLLPPTGNFNPFHDLLGRFTTGAGAAYVHLGKHAAKAKEMARRFMHLFAETLTGGPTGIPGRPKLVPQETRHDRGKSEQLGITRGGKAAGGEAAAARPGVAEEAVRPGDTTGHPRGQDQGQSPGAATAPGVPVTPARINEPARVPAPIHEVNRNLDRYANFFRSKGQHQVAEWIGMLKDHVNHVGVESALESLGPHVAGKGEAVQYGGHMDVGDFARQYLSRNGISLVHGSAPVGAERAVSTVAPSRDVEGLHQRSGPEGARDVFPALQTLRDKLHESQHLPGLETSEDLGKVVGKEFGARVHQLDDNTIGHLDSRYGKGQWIVKPYGDEAYAGYGIYFPQRAQQVRKDAQDAIWSAGEHLAPYGFRLGRNPDTGKIQGLVHESGDIYQHGTPEYDNTIHGHVRQIADSIMSRKRDDEGKEVPGSSPAESEHGAGLPEGRFMAQPAFPVVGISNEERAAGVTFKRGQEGRVHISTENGKASVVPHSTWLKQEHLPVVFENDDTRAMAKAAVDAINALPESERKGQLYAPDVVKTRDGYKVVEANPANEAGASGYLQDNPFVIDSYVSHVTGREPAHVKFVRSLLTRRGKGGTVGNRMGRLVANMRCPFCGKGVTSNSQKQCDGCGRLLPDAVLPANSRNGGVPAGNRSPYDHSDTTLVGNRGRRHEDDDEDEDDEDGEDDDEDDDAAYNAGNVTNPAVDATGTNPLQGTTEYQYGPIPSLGRGNHGYDSRAAHAQQLSDTAKQVSSDVEDEAQAKQGERNTTGHELAQAWHVAAGDAHRAAAVEAKQPSAFGGVPDYSKAGRHMQQVEWHQRQAAYHGMNAADSPVTGNWGGGGGGAGGASSGIGGGGSGGTGGSPSGSGGVNLKPPKLGSAEGNTDLEDYEARMTRNEPCAKCGNHPCTCTDNCGMGGPGKGKTDKEGMTGNAWTESAKKAVDASKRAGGFIDSGSALAATKAASKSGDEDDHSDAADEHDRFAALHDAASQYATGQGDHATAGAHMEARDAHRDAAACHRKYNVTGNTGKSNPRAEAISNMMVDHFIKTLGLEAHVAALQTNEKIGFKALSEEIQKKSGYDKEGADAAAAAIGRAKYGKEGMAKKAAAGKKKAKKAATANAVAIYNERGELMSLEAVADRLIANGVFDPSDKPYLLAMSPESLQRVANAVRKKTRNAKAQGSNADTSGGGGSIQAGGSETTHDHDYPDEDDFTHKTDDVESEGPMDVDGDDDDEDEDNENARGMKGLFNFNPAPEAAAGGAGGRSTPRPVGNRKGFEAMLQQHGSPDEIETWNQAKQAVTEKKLVIVRQLVGHIPDARRRNLVGNKLMAHSLKDLQERLELMPPPPPRIMQQPPIFNGAASPYAGEAATVNAAEEEGLDLPVTNWQELDGTSPALVEHLRKRG